ncbi:MAG TPA: hypothetical protein VH703_07135 [Solirubrobacterales bacterium]
MPRRLRPKTELSADAILVGDPGRSLLLAQELLDEPQMSNHARGLWGYAGRTAAGERLTIQATGMGGPSAALVLADLAELGVERVVRVGTCAAVAERAEPGELLLVDEALAAGGSATSFGVDVGDVLLPDVDLQAGLRRALGNRGRIAAIASLDTAEVDESVLPDAVLATDLQTVAVWARGAELEISTAALLIVSEAAGARLDDERLDEAARRAGSIALEALFPNPQP